MEVQQFTVQKFSFMEQNSKKFRAFDAIHNFLDSNYSAYRSKITIFGKK